MIRFAIAALAAVAVGLFAPIADACPLQQNQCYSQQFTAAYVAPPVQQVFYQPPPQQIVAAPVQTYYAPAPVQQFVAQPVYGQQLNVGHKQRLNVQVGAYAAPANLNVRVRGPLLPRLPRNRPQVVVPVQAVQQIRY